MDVDLVDNLRAGIFDADTVVPAAAIAIGDPEGREALYDGMRLSVSSLLRAHADEEEVARWREVLTHLSGLARHSTDGDADARSLLATRLDALRDLSADAEAFQRLYSAERLGDFPLYRDLLGLLHRADGKLPRTTIVRTLGLSESNATRVLKLLEAAGLLRRHRRADGVASSCATRADEPSAGGAPMIVHRSRATS